MFPELLDVVELSQDMPEHGLAKGRQGTIVELFPDSTFEVEFSNEYGETEALITLSGDKFVVVWKASTERWV